MMGGKLVFFVVATYGEGEPTDNAQDAYNFFKDEEFEETALEGIKFVVFGLGNKTYDQYNVIGQFWDTTFAKYGANRVYEMGLGDDDGKYAALYFSLFLAPRRADRWRCQP